jgi:hypothetical protein
MTHQNGLAANRPEPEIAQYQRLNPTISAVIDLESYIIYWKLTAKLFICQSSGTIDKTLDQLGSMSAIDKEGRSLLVDTILDCVEGPFLLFREGCTHLVITKASSTAELGIREKSSMDIQFESNVLVRALQTTS